MFKRVLSVALVASVFGVGCSVGDPEGADGAALAGDQASGGEGANAGGAAVGSGSGAGASSGAGAGAGEGSGAGASSESGSDRDDLLENSAREDSAPSPVITRADWMARTPGLADKPLNEIFVPGTHDSGTFALISVYDRPASDPFAPDAAWYTNLGAHATIPDIWAKAQEKTIKQQLEDGMRYIDLRPCREKDGGIRICHGLYGPTMSDLLDDVKQFSWAHPKEIVFVELGAFTAFENADHVALGQLVSSKLGSRMLDYGAGDYTPTSKLGDVWAAHPEKSIVVIYSSDSRPLSAFMPVEEKTYKGSWENTWNKIKKENSLIDAMQSAPAGTFFNLSGQATPDEKLLALTLDPLSNHPRNLRELADETNPVMMQWLTNDWAKKRTNLISLDYYNRTCLYEATLFLNGGADRSILSSCNIGPTNWGQWALGPYGRGAGKPLTCAADEEMIAGLCYTKCNAGYSWNIAFPYLCTSTCPAGYRNEPLTCMRDVSTVSANTSKCKFPDYCGLVTHCSKCPDGYTNTGCTCTRGAHSIAKSKYDRGVGRIPSSCAGGLEKDGLLCYPPCRSGYVGVGPMCHAE